MFWTRGTGAGKVPKVQKEDHVCEQVNPFPEKQCSAKWPLSDDVAVSHNNQVRYPGISNVISSRTGFARSSLQMKSWWTKCINGFLLLRSLGSYGIFSSEQPKSNTYFCLHFAPVKSYMQGETDRRALSHSGSLRGGGANVVSLLTTPANSRLFAMLNKRYARSPFMCKWLSDALCQP